MRKINPENVFQGSVCKRNHDGLRYKKSGQCVECARIHNREFRARYPERNNLYQRRYWAKRPWRRELQWRRYYGIKGMTIERYDAMLAEQGGLCAICGKPPKQKRLAVDHDHVTGEARGLLCGPCNTMLGRMEELWDAIDAYYRKHRAVA